MGKMGFKRGLKKKLTSEEMYEFFDWLLGRTANQKI